MADAPDTAQLHAEFEAWYEKEHGTDWGDFATAPSGNYSKQRIFVAFSAYRAGKAATPSPPVAAPPATPVAQGWIRKQFGYQTLFNAIAAATKPEAGGVSVSVKAFEDAMAAAQPQPQPAQPLTGAIPLVEEMVVASDAIAKLNHALVEDHGAIAVVYVDFGTKWFTITSIGTDHEDIPNVGLEVSETAPDVEVSLPGRKGWRIVSASASKYSLTVVLKAPGAAPKGDSNG